MKSFVIYILLLFCSVSVAYSQTLAEAREMYLKGEYAKALPIFEAEYNAKPTDANLNQWYGVCLFETAGDMKKAEELLAVASKKNIQESFFYLGQIYTNEFRFAEAADNFDKFETLVKKHPRRRKDDLAKYESDMARLEDKKNLLSRLRRVVFNTEDIQVIDSIVVDKPEFLSAYKLSRSSGKLDYFNKVFKANKTIESTVYFNEKETKVYYGQPDKNSGFTLYSMEKLLSDFGNEKKISPDNFGLKGDVNYPYMMADGVTIYFAAKDEETLGGYDLFVSRYNMNNDTFLAPERLNMPFNSLANDYMMAIDEEKGVGWFASDRYQPEGKVCIYTFIPNQTVKVIDSEDEKYVSSRARISSIKDSWEQGKDYSQLITLARKAPKEEVKIAKDFEFVINDKYTYYRFADFKNKAARDTYFNVVQMKANKKNIEEKLEKLRDNYNKADQASKRNLTSEILNMETQLEQLQKDVPTQEVQARNLEVQNLR